MNPCVAFLGNDSVPPLASAFESGPTWFPRAAEGNRLHVASFRSSKTGLTFAKTTGVCTPSQECRKRNHHHHHGRNNEMES